ncbi:MAG: AbrB/MazE/SpoVT family DNA-binding domain-containing protein [Pseudonocardiales bacterium]|nr:AbrB/MazE/SpoVT family DNA-binding domain-containing protein [Pseudonocardiales bacterium]
MVSEKGQVTIPKQLRDRLGIQPGEVLEFEEDGGRLIAVKQQGRDQRLLPRNRKAPRLP